MTAKTTTIDPTSLEQEEKKHAKWVKKTDGYLAMLCDAFVKNEFLPPKEIEDRQFKRLQKLLAYGVKNVPYIKSQMAQLNVALKDISHFEALREFPRLSRGDIQLHGSRMISEHIPTSHGKTHSTRSSGTTGEPVKVMHTAFSSSIFCALKQREYRWFDLDPRCSFASIREPENLPRLENGKELAPNQSVRFSGWPAIGRLFKTGDAFALPFTTPIDKQVEWLQENQPNYLLGLSANLEELALAFQGNQVPETLKGIHAISQQLTPEMRNVIEKIMHVPVYQNYGLNEIGIVAARCEAGRYHVHAEHAILEILDDEGEPCLPGKTGRVYVTGLNNFAMPLIRYDTDDLAEVVDGPCPCGRTLPSFGTIHGRYRVFSQCPEGTLEYWESIYESFEALDDSLLATIRQYQLHQSKDGTFELRIVAKEPIPDAFRHKLEDSWAKAYPQKLAELVIKEVPHIERDIRRKRQSFTSDFVV